MTETADRPGFVLVLAILAVVVAGALVVATHVAVTLEHRVAAAAIDRQRAFAASEHALWSAVAERDAIGFDVPPGAATTRVIRVAGDSAKLTAVRLNEQLYWLVADAVVGESRRRTGVNVRALTDTTGTHVGVLGRSWVDLH